MKIFQVQNTVLQMQETVLGVEGKWQLVPGEPITGPLLSYLCKAEQLGYLFNVYGAFHGQRWLTSRKTSVQ